MNRNESINLNKEITALPINLQQKVFEFIHTLNLTFSNGNKKKKIIEFAGKIAKEDLTVMEEAIQAECERNT